MIDYSGVDCAKTTMSAGPHDPLSNYHFDITNWAAVFTVMLPSLTHHPATVTAPVTSSCLSPLHEEVSNPYTHIVPYLTL